MADLDSTPPRLKRGRSGFARRNVIRSTDVGPSPTYVVVREPVRVVSARRVYKTRIECETDQFEFVERLSSTSAESQARADVNPLA